MQQVLGSRLYLRLIRAAGMIRELIVSGAGKTMQVRVDDKAVCGVRRRRANIVGKQNRQWRHRLQTGKTTNQPA
jgi:hypothetical protein